MSETTYCGHCGVVLTDGDHQRCATLLRMEPPRYCGSCARRMKVQVHPLGWSAVCVEHGTQTS
jgi:hypothetical protein